jgi:4'-phosphopantetheinyl transferase
MVQGSESSFAVGATEVVVARLVLSPAAIRASTALLSDAERQRARRLVRDRDRHRFIAARARLRQLLAARLGVRPTAVALTHDARGKPALSPGEGGRSVRFNMSRSGDLAVYVFSSGREVGIDVEAIRPIPDADGIVARFFAPPERDAYRTLSPRDRPLGFFNCWTRKEAFIKALGDGLSYPLDRFAVSLAPDVPARILHVADVPGASCGWSVESFAPAPGFVAAVVA